MYRPPNSQFVFIEKTRPAVGVSVRALPPTRVSSASPPPPAPPIRPAWSILRRETQRPPGASTGPSGGGASTGPSGDGASTGPSGGDASAAPPGRSNALTRLAADAPTRP